MQLRQAQILLAEVMPPLANTMRLVNRHQAEQATLMQAVQHGQKTRRQDALGRGVQQHQLAREQVTLDPPGFVAVQRAVQKGRGHAGFVQRAHLVVHQRNQRADHQRHALTGAVPGDGGHLVTQALAAAGGHQHQRITALHHLFDHRRLLAAEGGIAEDLLQDVDRVGRGGGGSTGRGHGPGMVTTAPLHGRAGTAIVSAHPSPLLTGVPR